jgi:hypothetical protein
MKANGTTGNKRQQIRGLTLAQENAIDLLVSGKNDRETAAALGLNRVTVSKWRLYDPVFQAGLNARREEVWGAGIDRLRSLVPKALEVLSGELTKEDSPNRLKAALEVLRLVRVPVREPEGPTDPEAIVKALAYIRWKNTPSNTESYLESLDGRPSMASVVEATWKELDSKLHEPEPVEANP